MHRGGALQCGVWYAAGFARGVALTVVTVRGETLARLRSSRLSSTQAAQAGQEKPPEAAGRCVTVTAALSGSLYRCLRSGQTSHRGGAAGRRGKDALPR
jgi:hypothetical protein